MSEQTNPNTTDRPTVFFVEEDDAARPLLTQGLRHLGYRVLVAASLEDAREWAGVEVYVHADLVLVNLVGKSLDESFRLGRELCDHAKYNGRTPLVVLAERVPEELAGMDVNVSGHDWICYLGDDPDQLRRLLARLLHGAATTARVLVTPWTRSTP